ncbi:MULTISPECIES: methionine ABC transporter ATP-binding protein [Rhodomicrobium]|uniref:methionine ABC transporter ATP-binding protein n=1 Tax=Rhodomicrobium TaxID=1068 RepID=UPI000B4B046D|nr:MULTISPECIES: methionine ABC transporter ATP-binding protein [Rhodomicrobium]
MNTLPRSTELIAAPLRPSPGPEPLIAFREVSKSFARRGEGGSVRALDKVSFGVERGDVFGIIGRSGAGKSTLIRLINGLERASAGRIVVDGHEITRLSERALTGPRRKIGMIFQHFNLLSSRTAFGNVALPLEIAGRSKAEIEARVRPLLQLVGLSDKHDRYPAELSGGQKQRVGIARALATEPTVLLCDEATSALDPETTASILALLADVNRRLGVTIVIITHEIPVIQAICNRVAVLEAGRIVEQGPVLDVFLKPAHPTTESFVRSVTGLELPPGLADAIESRPVPGGRAILQIVFTGPNATTPILSRLTTVVGVDINILAGRVGTIGGVPFGALLVAVPEDEVARSAVLGALSLLKQEAKVVGYVA